MAADATLTLLLAAEECDGRKTLLAVGSRGLGLVGPGRLDSVSTNVLRAAEEPALICSPQGGCRTSRPRDRAQRAACADGAVTVVAGEAARGTVAAEVARQEGAFLGRQRYRLERAKDTLVRELANR